MSVIQMDEVMVLNNKVLLVLCKIIWITFSLVSRMLIGKVSQKTRGVQDTFSK